MTDSKLVLLDPEQVLIILTALGHYSDEFALTTELPTINALHDRLTR